MAKPYAKLRHALDDADISRADIQQRLGRGKGLTYVAQRFQGERPWTLDDAYVILDMLGEPPNRIAEFFPRGG